MPLSFFSSFFLRRTVIPEDDERDFIRISIEPLIADKIIPDVSCLSKWVLRLVLSEEEVRTAYTTVVCLVSQPFIAPHSSTIVTSTWIKSRRQLRQG